MSVEENSPGDDPGTANLADVASIADTLAGEQPAVSEHVVSAEAEKSEQRAKDNAGLVDAAGNPFDPEQHVTDAEGQPVLTTTGKLRRRPGRKSGQGQAQQSHVGTPGGRAQNPGQVEQNKMVPRESGRHVARMMVGVAIGFGGEEWKPVKDEKQGVDEMSNLEGAFADYFEAKEWDDIPPGVALVVILCSYALPRFAMPHTKSKMGRFKDWLAEKYFAMKNRRHNKGKAKGPKPEPEKEPEGELRA